MSISSDFDDRSEHMTLSRMHYMPLTCAYLCADCGCVGNCASYCPACASRALIGLASVLNREEHEEIAPVSIARSAPRRGSRSNGASLAA
jgi:hypothetical protein